MFVHFRKLIDPIGRVLQLNSKAAVSLPSLCTFSLECVSGETAQRESRKLGTAIAVDLQNADTIKDNLRRGLP
jgi:hypothetical protein